MYNHILVAIENSNADGAVLAHIEPLARLTGARLLLVHVGFQTRARLAMGDPATQLVKVAAEESVDLIAMSTHGHRFLNDLLRGSTADRVRHNVQIPVLMVRAKAAEKV